MPHISHARYLELQRAEKALKERAKQDAVLWVGVELGRAAAMILATKPYSKWSAAEKSMLSMVCGNATAAMQIYIDLLPKE